MKNFFRAIRFILPYRGRLIISLLCVIAISFLWAGGLATVLPGMKILLGEEGLHGWSDQAVVQDRLGIKFIGKVLEPPSTGPNPFQPLLNQGITQVLEVTKIDEKSPLSGQLAAGEWVIGQGDKALNFPDLLAALAAEASEQWTLDVHNRDLGAARPVYIAPRPTGAKARMVRQFVSYVPREWGRAEQLRWMLILCFVINLLRAGMRICQEYLVESAIMQGMMGLRVELFDSSLHLPLAFYSSQGTSDTLSRVTRDVHEIARGLTTLFGKTMVEPAKLAACFVVALVVNWQLTLLACLAGPPSFLLVRWLGRRMKKATKRALRSSSTMLGMMDEVLAGLRVVKAYTTEPIEYRRFSAINRKLLKQQKRMAAVDSAGPPSVEFLGITAGLVVSWFVGAQVIQGVVKLEDALLMMAVMFALYDPIRKLSQVSTRFHHAEAAAERVFELRDRPSEKDPPGASELARHRKSIEFCDVTFTYPQASQPALRNVNLRIEQGHSVAVVGANGSGKTTLLSLVPRFFEPQQGVVRIDGTDIAEVSLRSLRGQIGVVTQETVIFHATVAENIAYGTPEATRAQVEAAARQAFVDDFVRELPEGYDTVLSERGASLSGGQRQRIAIARAILRDPAILIFDEAMSQIDSESEAKINQALETFMAGRTTLLIAHRFSTVLSADRVVVMHDGRIVDVGPHGELLERCDIYRTLFETQLVAGA